MNWYQKYYLRDYNQSSYKICFYKRTNKFIAAILAVASAYVFPIIGIPINFLGIFFVSALILDLITFKILQKKESTYKDSVSFEALNKVTLENFNKIQNKLVNYRTVFMAASIILSEFITSKIFDFTVYYTILSLITYFALNKNMAVKLYVPKPRTSIPNEDFVPFKSSCSDSSVNPTYSLPNHYGVPGFNINGAYTGSHTSYPSNSFPTPNFGTSGFNISGFYTGSPTAIGGISN